MHPRRIQLGGKAAGFLNLMLEYGHIAPEDITRIVHMSTPRTQPGQRHGTLNQAHVRRATASWLFSIAPETAPQGLLDEDWPLLFS
ncbi:MAG: hypothetical protein ACON5B_09340 [Myxococcota bacterium]